MNRNNQSIYGPRIEDQFDDPLNPVIESIYPAKACSHCGSQELSYSGKNEALCKLCGSKVHFDASLSDQQKLRNLLREQAGFEFACKEYQKALSHLNQAEKISEKILQESQTLSDFEMAADIYFEQGEIQTQLNRLQQALQAYIKAVEYRERAIELQQNDVSFYLLASSYEQTGKISRKLHHPDWKKFWKKEIKALKKAISMAQDPDNASFLSVYLRWERVAGQD